MGHTNHAHTRARCACAKPGAEVCQWCTQARGHEPTAWGGGTLGKTQRHKRRTHGYVWELPGPDPGPHVMRPLVVLHPLLVVLLLLQLLQQRVKLHIVHSRVHLPCGLRQDHSLADPLSYLANALHSLREQYKSCV